MDSSGDSLSNIKYADIGHDRAFLAAHSTSPSFWILDSGCSAHMISRKDLLSNIVPNNGIVTLANGMEILVKGSGTLNLNICRSTGEKSAVIIENVLYVPNLKGENLISESALELNGHSISSQNGRRKVFKNGKEWMLALLDNSLKLFVILEQKYNCSFASY